MTCWPARGLSNDQRPNALTFYNKCPRRVRSRAAWARGAGWATARLAGSGRQVFALAVGAYVASQSNAGEPAACPLRHTSASRSRRGWRCLTHGPGDSHRWSMTTFTVPIRKANFIANWQFQWFRATSATAWSARRVISSNLDARMSAGRTTQDPPHARTLGSAR